MQRYCVAFQQRFGGSSIVAARAFFARKGEPYGFQLSLLRNSFFTSLHVSSFASMFRSDILWILAGYPGLPVLSKIPAMNAAMHSRLQSCYPYFEICVSLAVSGRFRLLTSSLRSRSLSSFQSISWTTWMLGGRIGTGFRYFRAYHS